MQKKRQKRRLRKARARDLESRRLAVFNWNECFPETDPPTEDVVRSYFARWGELTQIEFSRRLLLIEFKTSAASKHALRERVEKMRIEPARRLWRVKQAALPVRNLQSRGKIWVS